MWALVACVSLVATPSIATPAAPAVAKPPPPDGAWDAAVVHLANGAFIGLYVCEAQGYCGNDDETASLALGAALGGVGGYVVGGFFDRPNVMMVNTVMTQQGLTV